MIPLATLWAMPAVRRGLSLVLKIGALIAIAWYADHRFNLWQQHQREEAAHARELEITTDGLRQELARMQADLKAERTRLDALTQELNEARQQSAKQVEVFNKHRFGELLQAKPELIESRVNKATTEVWTQIERESRL